MLRQNLIVASGVAFILGCHPTVPSDACKQQMSACLAKCNPDRDNRTTPDSATPRDNRTLCERQCETCQMPTTQAAPQTGHSATGAAASIPPGAISTPDGILLKTKPDAGVAPEAPASAVIEKTE